MRDLYAVLQVMPEAHADVIAAAYRALARRHHPDSGGDARAMMRLNAAWEVLGDPRRRLAYDEARRRAALERAAGSPAHSAAGGVARGTGITVAADVRTGTRTGAPTPIASRDPAVLDFGRYQGRSIAELARTDPDYLLWLARTPAGRRFAAEIRARVSEDPPVAAASGRGRARR